MHHGTVQIIRQGDVRRQGHRIPVSRLLRIRLIPAPRSSIIDVEEGFFIVGGSFPVNADRTVLIRLLAHLDIELLPGEAVSRFLVKVLSVCSGGIADAFRFRDSFIPQLIAFALLEGNCHIVPGGVCRRDGKCGVAVDRRTVCRRQLSFYSGVFLRRVKHNGLLRRISRLIHGRQIQRMLSRLHFQMIQGIGQFNGFPVQQNGELHLAAQGVRRLRGNLRISVGFAVLQTGRNHRRRVVHDDVCRAFAGCNRMSSVLQGRGIQVVTQGVEAGFFQLEGHIENLHLAGAVAHADLFLR